MVLGVAPDLGEVERGPHALPQHPHLQGYLAHKKTLTPLGPPWDPGHRPTVGSSILSSLRKARLPPHIRYSCTGVPPLQENAFPWDPTVGLCLGSYGGPRRRGRFFMSKVPLYVPVAHSPEAGPTQA